MNEKNYLDPELIPVRFMADDVIATSNDPTQPSGVTGEGPDQPAVGEWG